jgi:hypothetical protein
MLLVGDTVLQFEKQALPNLVRIVSSLFTLTQRMLLAALGIFAILDLGIHKVI